MFAVGEELSQKHGDPQFCMSLHRSLQKALFLSLILRHLRPLVPYRGNDKPQSERCRFERWVQWETTTCQIVCVISYVLGQMHLPNCSMFIEFGDCFSFSWVTLSLYSSKRSFRCPGQDARPVGYSPNWISSPQLHVYLPVSKTRQRILGYCWQVARLMKQNEIVGRSM